MGIKGLIFIALAAAGAALNFSSKAICEKSGISELKIKIIALIIVIVSIALLFIFGK